jgi:hypothetical protein
MITTATMTTIMMMIITAVIAGGILSKHGYQTRGIHGGVKSHWIV